MFTYVCKLLYSTTCQLHVPVGTQVSPTAASALICISFFFNYCSFRNSFLLVIL